MTGAETRCERIPVPHHMHAIGGRDRMAAREFSKYARIRYTDDQMLAELRRAALTLQAVSVLSAPKYSQVGRISIPAISKRFGSWRAAVEAAGLRSPTMPGGKMRPCDVCGAAYRWSGGKKGRKTCSSECSRELRDRIATQVQSDTPTAQASRGRARLLLRRLRDKTLSCERCGVTEAQARIEVHHKDRDWRNNDPSNLASLCRPCHSAEHTSLKPITCPECGREFHPPTSKSITCGRHCAGKRAAMLRLGRAS